MPSSSFAWRGVSFRFTAFCCLFCLIFFDCLGGVLALRATGVVCAIAGLTPLVSIVLELTRIGQLFEVYESTTSAAKSFDSFLPNVGFDPHHRHPQL